MSLKSRHIYIITLFFLSLILFHRMQGQTYNFVNYTVENGLSQQQVLAVCQDRTGVMWFGTNGGGITKYDGNSYEYITDKNGLGDNVIYSIVEDKRGRILIGTNSGVTIYDRKIFKNYTTQNGLTHNRVYSFFFDSKGNTLLGTAKGVCILKDTTFSHYSIDKKIDSAFVFNIYEDTKNNLWFSTLGNGAYAFDGKKSTNYNLNDGFKTSYVYSILEFKKDVYWFLIEAGLYELKNGKMNQINPAGFSGEINYYNFFKDDKDSSVWISSNVGLIKLKDNKVQFFNQKNGLVSNVIWKIFSDREKNLWFASKENGISKLSSERFLMYTVKDGLISNKTNSLYQAKDGRYWICAREGISVFNNKEFINYYNKKDWEISNSVTVITEDNEGIMYIGTSYGILKFNGKTFNRVEASEQKIGLNHIYDIFIDEKKEIWLGTKLGVAKLQNGSIEEFTLNGMPQSFVFKIFKDHSGIFWFCTDHGGFRYDGVQVVHLTEKDGFTTKSVSNVIEDKDNNLWFATRAGLYKYEKGKFFAFTEKNGLASNIIQSLAMDNKGAMWVGLPNGISKIQINTKGEPLIRHYGIDDGFWGEGCVQNAILIDNQSKIWFGAEKGLMVYQPEFDRKNELEPFMHIKSIQMFGETKTDWKHFADSVNEDNIPVNLELEHHKNYLTFNFVAVSLTASEKVRYKWMLRGLEKDWRVESSETEAVYSNLSPGKYEFMVIACNSDGVWNKEPVTFKFTILPPFWQTWWFYSIIAAIVLSGIYSYVKIRASNIKIVKQSHIIEEKNAEIKKAYSEIAGKNKNITDSINYAQRIQQSFLSSDNLLKQSLKDYFILFQPRDIVSGDFYWCYDLPDRTLIAGADSTGHGIPGAFMSLIGISLLNEISHSKKMLEPAVMLDELRRIIICALNPEQLDEGGKDGMDIALISIFKSETDEVKIHFSGGNNGLYLIASSENKQTDLVEYKGDKQPVGFYSNMKPFTQKEIIARKGDVLYMFTDGYADQFGGSRGKKFMSKQLKKTLVSISHLSLQEQKHELGNTFSHWKGELEQVDDVTVIGIKLS